jgi:predicted nucleotidyltransferase
MSNKFFDLSGKIDQKTIDALSIVNNIADSLGIRFFVVGATARDTILKHCYGVDTARMTRDIDLGVEVANWEQFRQLSQSLLSTGRFSSTSVRHRLQFDSIPIDIVPFGPITDKDGKISWPPEHEIFMNLLGFNEAYEYAVVVRLSTAPNLDIKLPSLSGLALMKIISWKEGYPERQRDAEDLIQIMQKYEEAGNLDRLFEQEQNLLTDEDFDTRNAGIRLLGRDMAMIAEPSTLAAAVRAILDDETRTDSQYRLVADMIRGTAPHSGDFTEILDQIEKLKQGFVEASMSS